ncbi:hypothetical protein, partial [Staphylococcus epidermidis]
MGKKKVILECMGCGYQCGKWMGKWAKWGGWNEMEERVEKVA